MKKYLLPLLSIAAIMPMTAGELNLQSKSLLNRQKMVNEGKLPQVAINPNTVAPLKARKHNAKPNLVPINTTGETRAFVKIAPGFTTADLEAIGMTVHSLRGDIAIVSMPTDKVAELAKKDCVKKLTVERQMNAHMDIARAETGVQDIQDGTSLKVPYTGKGVLAAVIDQGVDPNHVSFFDQEGKNRIKFLTFYDGTANAQGYPKTQYYGDNIIYKDDKGNVLQYPTIDKFTTDTDEAYHGTHTLNILGGSYKGKVSVSQNGSLKEIDNPYYGAAPEADLAVSCGDLSDACVAMGLAEILSYADYRREAENMPSVVSMSLGSTAGPHDPNASMNDYLAYCGESTILVVSAGNEGNLKIALNKTFNGDDDVLTSLIYPYGFQYDPSLGKPSNSNTYYRNGMVAIYSNDGTPFTAKAFIMTGEPGNYRKRATLDISSQEGNYYLSDSSYEAYVGGAVNSTVARYFDGFIGGGSMLDEELGRYYGIFDYYLVTNPTTGINEDGSEAVIVGFEITGANGQRIDCFCDGVNTWLSDYGLEGFSDGMLDGTISDMAVGDNVLVVGAYNTRNDWTTLDGTKYVFESPEGFGIGEIGEYSSYGTMPDGSTLPHVCAPGTAIVSAASRPWVESYFAGYNNYIPKNMTAKATANGNDYYWIPQSGTSMSTPLVAGSIALWLEADPDLTIDDVKEIIAKTSIKDAQVLAGIPAQWGAGKFDALAGLKEVISRSDAGVNDIQVEDRNDRLIITEDARGVYTVFVGMAKTLDVNVYSMAGSCVFSRTFNGNEATLDLNDLSKGVYVVKVNNHVSKIYIK